MIPGTSVNAQSSIRIPGSKILVFDPYQVKTPTHDADIIFITHAHSDHLSPDSIHKCANDSTIFVVPESMRSDLENLGIKDENIVAFKPSEKKVIEGINVEAVPAYNLKKPFHKKSYGWLGYVVELDGDRIYVCGDTDATPEGMAVKCDTAFIPIGGTFTMNAKQAAKFANAINPKTAVPIHYGSIVGGPKDAETFKNLLNDNIEVQTYLS